MKSITFLLPTNKKETAFQYILNQESLTNIKSLAAKMKLSVAVIGQGDFGVKEASTAQLILKSFGIDCKFKLVKEQPIASMATLRQLCCDLYPKSDYYLFADDNFEFTSGTPNFNSDSGIRYLQAVDYLERNDRCGVVMCEGPVGGYWKRWKISPTEAGLVSTARGLVFRNSFKGNLYPLGGVGLLGGYEELLSAYQFIELGYFVAKQYNNPTKHWERKKIDRNDDGPSDNSIHNNDVAHANIIDWIINRYGKWTQKSPKLPSELLKRYAKAGGPGINELLGACPSCGQGMRNNKFILDYQI